MHMLRSGEHLNVSAVQPRQVLTVMLISTREFPQTCALDQLLQLQKVLRGLLDACSNATGALAKF